MNTRSKFAFVIFAVGIFVALSTPALAENEAAVTYYEDVLPIIQDNCQTCHRDGGYNISGAVAPMAFTEAIQFRASFFVSGDTVTMFFFQIL